LHGKRLPVELIVHMLACLAAGLGICATARVFAVDPNTVLPWLVEAAEQRQAFTLYFLCDVHVTPLQLDELYAVLCGLREGHLSEEQALKRLEPGCLWVWTATDPVSKLLLAIAVGPRTLEMAPRVVHQIVSMLAPGCMPAWFSDGFKGYLPAMLGHFGGWTQPKRLQERWRRVCPTTCGRCVKSCSTASRPGPNRMRCKGWVKLMMVVVIQGTTGLFTLRSTPVNEVQQTGFQGS
jgi:hypothetical protein